MKRLTLSEKRARAGRIGGITTALRHQGKHQQWGKLGGRPPLPTLDELRAQRRPLRLTDLPDSVPALLKLYREGNAYDERLRKHGALGNRKGSLPRAGSPKEG